MTFMRCSRELVFVNFFFSLLRLDCEKPVSGMLNSAQYVEMGSAHMVWNLCALGRQKTIAEWYMHFCPLVYLSE